MKKFLKKPRHTVAKYLLDQDYYYQPKTLFIIERKILIPFEAPLLLDKPEGLSISIAFLRGDKSVSLKYSRPDIVRFVSEMDYDIIYFDHVPFPGITIDISDLIYLIESDDLDPNALSEELEKAVADGKLRLAAELKKKIEELKNAAS